MEFFVVQNVNGLIKILNSAGYGEFEEGKKMRGEKTLETAIDTKGIDYDTLFKKIKKAANELNDLGYVVEEILIVAGKPVKFVIIPKIHWRE